MNRATFDAIRRKRPPTGDEVIAYVEAHGFRVVGMPLLGYPVLACDPGTPRSLLLEMDTLVLDHADAVYAAALARRELYRAAGWGERTVRR